MIHEPQKIIDEFSSLYKMRTGVYVKIEHEVLLAPHKPPRLKEGCCAVYVFSLASSSPLDSSNIVLKVGKAGKNSNNRFQSQHYSPNSCNSNLAKSLVSSWTLWPTLDIDSLTAENIRSWMLHNIDRDHFYISQENEEMLGLLEKHFRGKLRPMYEG